MKILHAGNMVNLGYFIVNQLRQDGLDVDLLMEKNPPFMSNPSDIDQSLQNSYPDWIHFFDKSKKSWKFDIIKLMRNKEYDLIHAYVEFPIFSQFSNKKYVAYAQGSDLRELAISNSIRGIMLRRAYRKARVVITAQPDHIDVINKLNLKNWLFLPVPWDMNFFKPISYQSEFKNKFVIFHPASLFWKLKGNDILIKGFAEFSKEHLDSLLLIVDRGIDSIKTKELIKKLQIENQVQFISGPLNRHDLLKYYNICDVVADQFIVGSMGSISLESMLCEKPVITYIKLDLHQQVYSEIPPIISVSTTKDVVNSLELLKNEKTRKIIGKQGRVWTMKYHSPHTFSANLKTIYLSILNGDSIDTIKSKIIK